MSFVNFILPLLSEYKEVIGAVLVLVMGVGYRDRRARKNERLKREAAEKDDALERSKRLAGRKHVRTEDIRYRD